MIAFVAYRREFDVLRKVVTETAETVQKEMGVTIPYDVGTMIELPRATLRAADIAGGPDGADFFSFGTNDLTQAALGLSRDDAAPILSNYLEHEVISTDPFVTIDQRGVGELVKIGVERGRAAKPGLKTGICGEHGGDPKSIGFFENIDLDYVSCSPFRVPIARLAAAQATIRRRAKAKDS
jgi:pyruvate,orthophosphate dikinase